MKFDENPFDDSDPDRKSIWEMLVYRDIEAFLEKDFNRVRNDFSSIFMGIDGRNSLDPDRWTLKFKDLEEYESAWVKQAQAFSQEKFVEDKRQGLFNATILRDIEIRGKFAIVHKKFDGVIKKANNLEEVINWQTIYKCHKEGKHWKIIGFVGYLPYPRSEHQDIPKKNIPSNAKQHTTAGPYSPILEVSGKKLIVISGQASIDKQGKVVGDTIEEQTRFTLENCLTQLKYAKIGFKDVFKVNVYLTNLNLWERFNQIYASIMPKPFPVRTAVQTPLLYNFLVEIEMWGIV